MIFDVNVLGVHSESGGAAHGELDVPPAQRPVGHAPLSPGHPRCVCGGGGGGGGYANTHM